MKKIVFLMIVVSISSCLSTKKRVINYNHNIQIAENYILENNYKDAFRYYKKTINNTNILEAKNCYTATQLSSFFMNRRYFLKFCKLSFANGLEPKTYFNDSLINSYISSLQLQEKIQKIYAKARKKHEKKINTFLNDTIIKLSELDNKWKVHYIDSLSKYDSQNKKIYEKKYDSIVSKIVDNHLIELIKIYGYPFFNVNLERNGDSFGNNRAKLILLHYYSNPKTCNYNDLLKTEVFKGNLPAEQFAEIMDFQALIGNTENCKVGYYNEWHICKDSLMNSEINMRRNEIGLRSFDEKIRKFERGKEICKEKREKKKYKQIKLFYWCG